VKYWVYLSVLKFEDTWYGRKLRHVRALITAGNGVDATRIQLQNILSELLPVYKAVPNSTTCNRDIVLEHHFHPKALLACHHPACMRLIPRAHSLARTNIYTLEQTTKAQKIRYFNLGARRGWVVNATPRPLYPREAWWAPGPVWTGTKNLAATWIRSSERIAIPTTPTRPNKNTRKHTCI
jgi:hypothetical protein